MHKEDLQLFILDFTKEDLMNCRNNVMSVSMVKKIKSHVFISLIVSYILLFVFTICLIFLSTNKGLFLEQIQSGGHYVYYLFVVLCILLVCWLLVSLVVTQKKYGVIENETITSIDVAFSDIQTASRGRYAANKYLITPEIEFKGFLRIRPPAELFDEGEKYRIYFSSISKIFLATEKC